MGNSRKTYSNLDLSDSLVQFLPQSPKGQNGEYGWGFEKYGYRFVVFGPKHSKYDSPTITKALNDRHEATRKDLARKKHERDSINDQMVGSYCLKVNMLPGHDSTIKKTIGRDRRSSEKRIENGYKNKPIRRPVEEGEAKIRVYHPRTHREVILQLIKVEKENNEPEYIARIAPNISKKAMFEDEKFTGGELKSILETASQASPEFAAVWETLYADTPQASRFTKGSPSNHDSVVVIDEKEGGIAVTRYSQSGQVLSKDDGPPSKYHQRIRSNDGMYQSTPGRW